MGMMDMINLGKIRKTITLDPNPTSKAINMAQFYGYGNLSDLLTHLLNKWVENPEKKEVKKG